MYCGMGCLCIKEERKVYFASAVEAINGRASHWSSGSRKTNYYNDACDTLWQTSDFPWPEDNLNENDNDDNIIVDV
uniref:Ovule protein n=1 Tax=Strongyloides papillosus TaxID=174720 RepID=A0A0N5BGS3_STREA